MDVMYVCNDGCYESMHCREGSGRKRWMGEGKKDPVRVVVGNEENDQENVSMYIPFSVSRCVCLDCFIV